EALRLTALAALRRGAQPRLDPTRSRLCRGIRIRFGGSPPPETPDSHRAAAIPPRVSKSRRMAPGPGVPAEDLTPLWIVGRSFAGRSCRTGDRRRSVITR